MNVALSIRFTLTKPWICRVSNQHKQAYLNRLKSEWERASLAWPTEVHRATDMRRLPSPCGVLPAWNMDSVSFVRPKPYKNVRII